MTLFQIPSAIILAICVVTSLHADELPGTKPLTAQGDLAAKMVEGIDKYLMRELNAAAKGGDDKWHVKTESWAAYLESVKPNRERLAKILGVVDERIHTVTMNFIGEGGPSALVGETAHCKIYAVRWPVLPGIDGEGLLLEPNGKVRDSFVAIPDADQTPEMLVGLAPGIPPSSQFARHLAESGIRVIVPVLIDRKDSWSANAQIHRQTNISHREFVWRMAYEMGRHIIGFEVQKVLAAVDWLKSKGKDGGRTTGVMGYGEGGIIALYSAALDHRIFMTGVSGVAFDSRHNSWQEPIDRQIWGLLPEFSDKNLFNLIDGILFFEQSFPPKIDANPNRANQDQAAPGRLKLPDSILRIIGENKRNHKFVQERKARNLGAATGHEMFVFTADGQLAYKDLMEYVIDRFGGETVFDNAAPKDIRKNFDPLPRQKRQFDQLVAFTQKLWRQSELVRKQYWVKADASSPQKWEQSCEPYRNTFWEEIIGKLPKQTEPMNPQTRLAYDTPKWKGYEVTLDLYPDVFAYGILLLPKDLKPGEKRPVVVCQHGLEGRPQDVVNPEKRSAYYNSFGAQLADMGYIVYAPQNPYIGHEKFRVLLRKAHPLKLSLYAFIVRQHETTTDWLASLPFVQADKIAFYGLSYGGKTAMRIPALVKWYCLSICAGDFNEWVGKCVSVDFPGSYMWTNEYDMYEFNLGNTFNYAEMANLIAPRPFMVERGHDDGVGIDEMVAYEYAKVRYLYANRLKIPQNTAIEFRPGGHEIFLKGTADFLKTHTGWPK